MSLLNIGGEKYFLDFTNLEKVLSSGSSGFKGGMVTEIETKEFLDGEGKVVNKEVITRTFHKSKEVDGFRYETLRLMTEILLATPKEEEGEFSNTLENMSISYKLAFNTLLEYGILNLAEEGEEE